MKTIDILLAIFAVALSCISCDSDNIEMTTVVNRDGSFSRVVRFESDSLSMIGAETDRKNIVNVLGNEAWCKDWSVERDTVAAKNGVDRMKYFCTATRDFNSVSELNANFPVEINGTNILKNASLDYSFRGFYTDITFKEVYVDLSPAFSVPGKYFLNDDELSYWVAGTPNIIAGMPGMEAFSVTETLQNQFLKWYAANQVYDELTLLADSYSSFHNCPLSKEQILAVRDRLALEEQWNGALSLAMFNRFFNSNQESSSSSHSVASVLETDYFLSPEVNFVVDNLKSSANFDAKYENLMVEVDYQLVMPGRLLSTGNGTLKENNVVAYRLSGLSLLSHDYTVTATSRVINYWFFVLALLLIITPIVITVYIRRKRNVA